MYASGATSGREANPDEKAAGVLETFEITTFDELHPNVADTIRRTLLGMESDKLLDILLAIADAKERYRSRRGTPSPE